MAPQKDIAKPQSQKPMNVTLFSKKAFVDGIKDLKKEDLEWALNAVTAVLSENSRRCDSNTKKKVK